MVGGRSGGGGLDLSSLARVGQGERFTPAGGSRFTAVSQRGAPTTSRPASAGGFSVRQLVGEQPSQTALDLSRAARTAGGLNFATGGMIPGLSSATSIANLLARFNDPRVSDARLGLGTAGDVSGLVNTAARFEPFKSLLAPITAPGALPSLAPSAAAGASALSLGASEGATAATEAFINAYQAAIDAGATSSQALNAALSTGTLPTGSILAGLSAVLGLGTGALAASEGSLPGAVAGFGSGAAGLAAATGLIPASGAAIIAAPLALTALAAGKGEGLAANLGLGNLFGKKDILHNKQREAALQKHLAAGAISHMQNVLKGGFQIPDIMAYLTSPDNMSNQGHAGAGTAEFRSTVWAEMMRKLSDHVAGMATTTGKPFAHVWRDELLKLAPTLAQENRPLTYNLAEQPEYIGQANIDRLSAGMTPTPEMLRIADAAARSRINPEDPALNAETYQQALEDATSRNLKLLMLGSPLRGAGQATEHPAGGPNVFPYDPYAHLREGYVAPDPGHPGF